MSNLRGRGEPVLNGDVHLRSNLSIRETLRPFAIRFAAALAYFVALFVIAAIGYHFIEGWYWFDSVYMAVTTVSSVGFMEVHPLTPAGRTFTMVVIALGVTGLGIWWALITALIVELDLGGALRRRKKMKQIEELKGHYIVCGAGRVGRMVIREIRHEGLPLLVIERNEQRARRLEEDDPDLLVICADSTKERVLLEAGVERASGLAACLADDGDNLLVCLAARDLNAELSTVARAYDEESVDRLRRAGADHVISPTLTGGIRMASTLLRPHVVSFLDSAIMGPDMDLRLEEAMIPEGSPLHGVKLENAGIPKKTGLVVIALQRGGRVGAQIYNPGPDTRLEQGDVMIVLGREGQLQALRDLARDG
jgi:voltage-gated potassium channel